VWNGRWWVHVLYCSTHCEALHELERYARLPFDGSRIREFFERPAMSKLRMLSLAAAIVALVAYYSIQFYHLAVEPARAHTTERAR
jgi:hypothetical protein